MALIAKHENRFGQKVKHYWRYNGLLTSANRQPDGAMSVPTVALFRAFASEAAFKAGFHFLEERTVTFVPSSANANMADEAYAAFKAAAPPPELTAQLTRLTAAMPEMEANVAAVEGELAEAHTAAIEADKALADASDEDAEDRRRAARRATRRVAELTSEAEQAAATLSAAQDGLSAASAEQATFDAWAAVMTKAEQA